MSTWLPRSEYLDPLGFIAENRFNAIESGVETEPRASEWLDDLDELMNSNIWPDSAGVIRFEDRTL